MRTVVSVPLFAEGLLNCLCLVWCEILASGTWVFLVTPSVDDAIYVQVPACHGTIARSVTVVVGTSLVPLGAILGRRLGTHDDEGGREGQYS